METRLMYESPQAQERTGTNTLIFFFPRLQMIIDARSQLELANIVFDTIFANTGFPVKLHALEQKKKIVFVFIE